MNSYERYCGMLKGEKIDFAPEKLAGNLDPVNSVMRSDPEKIKSQIRQFIRKQENHFS